MRKVFCILFVVAVCYLTASAWVSAEEVTSAEDAKLSPWMFDNTDPCSPCGEVFDGCRKKKTGWEFDFGAWAEAGIYTNSHGSKSNGPMHTTGNERTDFHLDQFYMFGEAKYKTRSGVVLGGRADLVYGVDALSMQSGNDGSFDYDWGNNRHNYGMAAYQLYGIVEYEDLSVKIGKFLTPIGWEGSASKDNFFYSHSYCYWLEPSTHVGFVADYALTDNLTLSAGWTAGKDNGFQNKYDDSGFLAGFTLNLSDTATVYYWMTAGEEKNKRYLGDWRFGSDQFLRNDYFIQSLCFEWTPTDRFTYIMQYNLRNDNFVARGGTPRERYSAYGINNHFLYKINRKWGAGMRVEWARDNGGYGYIDATGEKANYFQLTLGLNWTPNKHFALRPEVRYDSVMDGTARPFGNDRRDQVSGGIGMLYIF